MQTRNRYPIAPVTAAHLGSEITGDPGAVARQVSNLENADASCLTFCLAGRENALAACTAAIVLAAVSERERTEHLAASAVVWVNNPMLDFVRVLEGNGYGNGTLSAGGIKEGGYFLADDASVGAETEISPMAAVHAGSVIGVRCRIQSGATIGAVGLGYAEEDGSYIRFPHLGRVIIEDDVDIGAGTTVVRGILQDTLVGAGSRIGNNVNIGHNVRIGKSCFVSAGVVLAGSVRLEDSVWVAPGAILLNGVTVGAKAQIGPGTILSKDAKPGYRYVGSPARSVKKV